MYNSLKRFIPTFHVIEFCLLIYLTHIYPSYIYIKGILGLEVLGDDSHNLFFGIEDFIINIFNGFNYCT